MTARLAPLLLALYLLVLTLAVAATAHGDVWTRLARC